VVTMEALLIEGIRILIWQARRSMAVNHADKERIDFQLTAAVDDAERLCNKAGRDS
jgi:uncharacterized Tic20 family protein